MYREGGKKHFLVILMKKCAEYKVFYNIYLFLEYSYISELALPYLSTAP